MSTTWHVADVQDPITGETTTLRADTEKQLEQLVEEHLSASYPDRS